jgi:tetratricopeptide (TPR) repeat protein
VRDLKSTQAQLITHLQQQIKALDTSAKQAGFFQARQLRKQQDGLQQDIGTLPQRLQSAVSIWQNNHQAFIDFSDRFDIWRNLLDSKIDQVLKAVGTLGDIDTNVKTLLKEFREFKRHFYLSTQVSPRDEFTHHSSNSLTLIQKAVSKLKRLPVHNYELSLLAGSVVSSTGEITEAEKLFIQALEVAQNQAEKALVCFNLFQIRLRRQAYSEALVDLQSAIEFEPNYALHDFRRYSMRELLGAGGMGCVFLCRDELKKRFVVVKCFWEKREGTHRDVFKEAMTMDQIAGEYVPEPLDCGYVNAAQQDKPYFVTEYFDGALDGEVWLKKYGKLDVSTGLDVGIHIARGLQVAPKAYKSLLAPGLPY